MAELHRPGIAIMASGSGTTAEAVIRATQTEILDAEIGLIICSRPPVEAGIYERKVWLNEELGLDIPVIHISGKTYPGGPRAKGEQTEEEAEAIAEALGNKFVLTLLAGYMRKVHPLVLADRDVINTHPGPLPQTAGMYGVNVQKHVLETGLGYSAHTVHLVDENYDTGPVIAVHKVPVLSHHTAETLFDDVQIVEKENLPKDMDELLRINGKNRVNS